MNQAASESIHKLQRRTKQALLREIVQIRRMLRTLPDPENFERHEQLHRRLDELVLVYMKFQRAERRPF